ncbi:MAG: DMT family transporter, partial [Anaerovorax sp.]
IGGTHLDPFQLTFIRFTIGGLFLLPFAIKELKERNVKLVWRDYAYLLFLGVLCTCVSMIFFQIGVMNANASTAAVLFCINPMFTITFAHFFTSEKLTKQKIVALVISLVGIAIIINPFAISEGNTLMGMLFTLISALTFGLYSAIGKRRIERIGGLPQTSISFLLGSLALLFILLVTDGPILQGVEMDNILVILYVSIIVTGVGYLFYFKAMEVGGAAKASIVFFLKPVFAPIVAVIMFGEIITFNMYIGIAFILLGSYINMKMPKEIKEALKEGCPNES